MIKYYKKAGFPQTVLLFIMLLLLVLSFGCSDEPVPLPEIEKADVVRRSIIVSEDENHTASDLALNGKESEKKISDDIQAVGEDSADFVFVEIPVQDEKEVLDDKAEESSVKKEIGPEVADKNILAASDKGVEKEGRALSNEKEEIPVSDIQKKKPADVVERIEEVLVLEEKESELPESDIEAIAGMKDSDESIPEAVTLQPVYNPEDRIDPFRPLIQEKPRVQQQRSEERPERRIPQTPLEKVDLSQLKLVGIVRSPMGPRAMVEESSGRGYVVTEGTYMGLHGGRVTAIDRDKLVVTEIVENFAGEFREEEREMRLQKPTGE